MSLTKIVVRRFSASCSRKLTPLDSPLFVRARHLKNSLRLGLESYLNIYEVAYEDPFTVGGYEFFELILD